jgi:hypothetical protein
MEQTQMRKAMTELEFELGPDLTEQEWQKTLQTHRKAMIAKLRAIFRKDIVVTKQQREEIERAAHGIWTYDDAREQTSEARSEP